jgi:tricorn protease-like protein
LCLGESCRSAVILGCTRRPPACRSFVGQVHRSQPYRHRGIRVVAIMAACGNGYFRHPTLSATHVAFVSEDDVWVVPRHSPSCVPVRLTSDGCCSHPKFSPNGEWIAYTSFITGSQEVYIISFEGGPPTQLTFFGADSLAVTWSPEGDNVIFTSTYRKVFISLHVFLKERCNHAMAKNHFLNFSRSQHVEVPRSLSALVTVATCALPLVVAGCWWGGTRLMAE